MVLDASGAAVKREPRIDAIKLLLQLRQLGEKFGKRFLNSRDGKECTSPFSFLKKSAAVSGRESISFNPRSTSMTDNAVSRPSVVVAFGAMMVSCIRLVR